DLGALARRVRPEPSPPAGRAVVLLAATVTAGGAKAELRSALLATMARAAAGDRAGAGVAESPAVVDPPMTPGPPFWNRPTLGHLWHAALLGVACTVWFGLVYGGADWLTHQHRYRVRLHTNVELAVPLVPAAVVGYMSLYPLFWIAPFVLRTGRE